MTWVRNEPMLGWRLQGDDSIKQFVRAHDGCGRTNQRECDKGMKAKKKDLPMLVVYYLFKRFIVR